MDEVAIKVENVSKNFKLPHEKAGSLKSIIVNFWRRERGYEVQRALQNVSFEIKKGEFFGVVGRNGSGKSTMLKLLAGIYAPDSGSITVNGKLTPFIELGVGFNQELTGRENVFLNGALLGFSRKEMTDMYDDIVEFAELERFMDQKLKNYSSGMQVRLAFSIAIKAQSDILLIDEVLAVGDAAFQRKCFDYFMKLKREKKTVVLVTHDMGAARQYCDSGIMLEGGKIYKTGSAEHIAQAYQKMFNDEIAAAEKRGTPSSDDRWGTKKVQATKVKVDSTKNAIAIEVSYKALVDVSAPVFGFNVYNSRGINVFEGNTLREKIKTSDLKAGEQVHMKWEFPDVLATDTYAVSVSSCNQQVSEFYDWFNNAATFVISKSGNTAGFIDPPLKVQLN